MRMSAHGLSLQTKVKRVDTVFSSSVGDDLVIFDHAKGAYYGSGPVGDAVWSLIATEQRIESVCDQLMEQFDVDRATCEAEVIEFLDDLFARGLVVTG